MDEIVFSQPEVDFLNSQDVGRLADSYPDGKPHVTPIIFAFSNGVLYFTTQGTTVKFLNITRNPNVSFVVDIYEEGGHKRQAVMIEGTVEEVTEDPEFSDAKKMLTDKLTYYQVNPIVKGTNHVFRITPTRKVSWGL